MITDIALHSASTGQQIATVAIGTGSKRYFQLMKHDYVELKFSSYQPFRVNIGDWIMLDSIGRYEVTKPFDPAANSSGEYGYELRLNAQYWKFANKLMKFMPQIGGKETSWTYTGTIADHANMVLCNLRALAFKRTTAGTEQFIPGREGFCPGGDKDVAWEVVWDETVDATKAVTVKFDSTNIIDGIGMIATELNCEWWFVNNTLHFGRCLVGDDNPVQLEKDKEFATLDGRETNENYATRIFAYGSTRNLASTYRKELVFEVTQSSGRDIVDGTRPLRPEWFNKTAIQTEATVLKKTVARPGLTVPLRVNGMTHTKSTQIADFTLDSLPAGSYAITNSASGAFRVGVTIKDYSGNHSDPTAPPEWSGLTSEVWIAVTGKMGVNNTQWDFNTHKTDSPQRNLDWERPTYFALTDNGEYATGFDLPLELHDVHIAVLIRNRNVAYEDDSYNVNSFVDITSQGELEVVCKTPAKKIEGLTVKVLDGSGAVSRTIAGVTLNPDFDTDETEASTLRLPSGDSLAVGTKFQLPDLRRNLVPASYFTSIYAAFEKYNDITVNGIVTPRLMLPLHDENGVAINGYIDACPFTSEEEAIEDVVVFEDVYPSRVSTITELWRSEEYADETEEQDGSVTTETWRAFVYQDDLFNENNPFDADAYMINGETLRITFQSGMLNGQTFEVRYIAESCGFEIIRDNDTLLPNDVVCPKIGDKFILHGFNIAMLSDEATDYVDLAEQDLLAKTREYIKNLNLDPSAYRIPLACDFAQEHCADIPGAACFPIGQSVNIVYPEYFENGRKSRVIGFEIPLDIPYDNPIYIIGEKPQFSRIGAIEDKLNNELKIAGSAVASTSSGGSSSGAYIIKRNDTTPASDANLFSAARAKVEFALKTAVQRITYLWKFIRGAEFGEYAEGQTGGKVDAEGNAEVKSLHVRGKAISNAAFEVGEFLAGISGGFFGIDQNGESYLEVARLYARVRAVFEELTVIKTGVLAGKQYITPGGGIVCTKVEEVTNASGTLTGWRCYFLSEQDGEKTECKFRANDQAISALFNAKTGTANKVSNHRYWRLVTAVDNDACTDGNGNHYGYIELSATDCEAGSDTPQAGDEICQLGNRTDATRQTAIVFSTVDADSPSIKMFGGIGSGTSNAEHYSLNGKAIISFGRDATTGKVYFRLGATGATQYLEYNQDGGLTLNGKLSIGSTIGDKPLDKYFTDLIPEIPEEYDDSEIKEEIDKYKYLAEALPQDTDVIGGVVLSTLVSLGYKDSDGTRHTLAGMNGSYVPELAGRTIGSWWGGEMNDIFNADGTKKATLTGKEATSLVRMDGSFYFANGNIGGRTDGSGWLAGDNITWDASGAITFGNGIKIDLGGGKNTTLGGIQDTLGSVLTIVNGLSNVLFPVDSTGARVDWGSPNTWAIKSVKGFFSDSFISARGANPDGGGSGGGGVYYLHELLDAAINNPASGQALIYNGTKWVNQAIQTGLDEAALASYLTTHSYATQSWVESKGYLTAHQSLANYVTLNTPQNITGAKTFSANVTFQQPVNTYGFRLRFLENAEFQGGFIGYDGANNIFSFGVHEAYDTNPSNDFNAISILRSNAYVGIGTLSPTQKLHVNGNALASQFIKSGGTASQFLMADGSVATKHVLTTANNLGWVGTQGQIPTIDTLAFWNGRYNATNSNLQYCDRGRFGTMAVANAADYLARSGGSMTNTNVVTNLNADLLDGLHIADIRGLGYAMQDTWIDASSLDVDTWYPVTLSLGSMNNVRIEVLVSLNSGTKPSWSLHNGGFSVRVIWEVNGSGWGASPINRTIYAADCGFTATSPVRGIGQMNHSSNEYVFVRGGGKYRFRTSHGAFPILRTSTYKPSTTDDQSVSPTTTAPAEIVRDNARTYDNVASATKLQTARMLWGQSFDGTANVSGSLTGVSSIGFNGDYELGIHNGRYVFGTTGQRSAVGANVGSLLVSNMWADATKVPTNGIYVKGDLRIGDITLSYDAANGGLHVSGGGLYADSYITARGANTSGGGSTGGGLIQQVYGSSSLGGAFSDTTLTDTFNAYTINKIRTDLINADSALSGRITSLEGGAAVSVTTTGSGNAITAISKSGTTITATKGATFLTAHQSLANYVTLNTTQTITGAKTFSTDVTFQQPVNTYGFRLRFLENAEFQGGFIGYDGANNIFSIGVHEAYDTNLSNDFNAISILRSNAYVGIGTTSPTQKLHVNGNALASQFIKSNGTASQFLMGDGSVVTKKSLSTVDNSGWTTFATDDKLVPTMAFIAYWNGRYNASNSNLQYCDRGRFGTIVTHAHSEYVTALGTSGDYLTWTKNGATNNITVPYATTAAQLTGSAEHTGTALADFDRTHTYTCQATNDLGDGISYSAILTVSAGSEHRFFQLIGGKGNPSYLRWRTTDANGKALGAVHRLLDDANYSSVLDSRYYTESEINAKLTNGSVTKVGTATVGSTAKGIYLNGGTPTALSATVGAANRPVYMNAGTITAGTYTFGNGSGNAPISNGTLCTNLNADLLDGLHNGALTARYLNLAALVTNCNAMPTHNGIFSWGGTNSANPATYGVLLQWSSVDNPTPGTDQHWITQLASATSNRLFYRTRINTGAWSGWSALAFTSDNVASATKLQTSRSLWGQSFNGTANVDGALTVHHTGACGVYISGGGESSYSCQASGGLRWVLGGYPDRFFIWDSSGNGNERLSILNNGSVGIGTTSPSAKLDVIGVIHSTVGIWSNGYMSGRGLNTASDSRLKAIMQTKLLDTRSIAAAPSVLFRWKDDGREDVGSIAQYWQRIDRHLVSHRPDGYLGLDYGKAALLSVISVAKQTLNHEARIKALEKENARLKEQIKSLT